jgi:hypothetical protein
MEIPLKEAEVQVEVRTRRATRADIPFLARIEYEASLLPLNLCFWDELLQETQTSTLKFIEAMLSAGAGNWGNAEDFLILESQGQSVAAAAGYRPDEADYRPLRLSHLDRIAQDLNWSKGVATTFNDRYKEFWGNECKPLFLAPQAPWIIENVAVLPEA